MIIPPERLDKAVLINLIESFITRDGTDYGEQEWTLEEKVEQLMPQVLKQEVLIVYDESSESVSLLTQHEYRDLQS